MSNENKIRVLYVQLGKYLEERVIEHTLAAMQALVGGDIEAVYPWEDNACVVCDDEGKLKHKPLNRPLEDYDVLSRDFFVCGLGEDDFTSLTDEQMKRYEQLYHDPVVFVPSFMGIIPMKTTQEQYDHVMRDTEMRKNANKEHRNHNER